MKEEALPRLVNILSPIVDTWAVFAIEIGVPWSQVSQITAANPPTQSGLSTLYTCLFQALMWWVNNHRNPTYETIIAVLDPEGGQEATVMNGPLARQVKRFMADEQKGEF